MVCAGDKLAAKIRAKLRKAGVERGIPVSFINVMSSRKLLDYCACSASRRRCIRLSLLLVV